MDQTTINNISVDVSGTQPAFRVSLCNYDTELPRCPGDAEVTILSYGGILQSFKAYDSKQDKMVDVVLGFTNVSGYQETPGPYFGAIVGRIAGRVSRNNRGSYRSGKIDIVLEENEEGVCLHGGHKGLDKQFWALKSLDKSRIVLEHTSKHGECGFEGNIHFTATYEISRMGNQAILDFTVNGVILDKGIETPLSITNHTYFNLDGEDNDGMWSQVLDHKLDLSEMTWCGDWKVPMVLTTNPKTMVVDNYLQEPFRFIECTTPADERKCQAITLGSILTNEHLLRSRERGLDHCFVAKTTDPFVVLTSKGRQLRVKAEFCPSWQVYSGNYLESNCPNSKGNAGQWSGVAIEPATSLPNAVNYDVHDGNTNLYSSDRPYLTKISYCLFMGNDER